MLVVAGLVFLRIDGGGAGDDEMGVGFNDVFVDMDFEGVFVRDADADEEEGVRETMADWLDRRLLVLCVRVVSRGSVTARN